MVVNLGSRANWGGPDLPNVSCCFSDEADKKVFFYLNSVLSNWRDIQDAKA
jgi:hypothetical protein